MYYFLLFRPRAGTGVARIDPLRFLAGCRKRQLNQVCLLCFFIVLLFMRALLCIVRFIWYLFCLLIVLAKLSVLAK